MATPEREQSRKEAQDEIQLSWRARFCLAFSATGFAMFAWCYFASPAKPFGEALLAGATVGLLFGVLAAVFGQRMLDLLLRIW